MTIQNGTTYNSCPVEHALGVAWYSEKMFSDFVLRGEFKGAKSEFNSGIRIRFPTPGQAPKAISELGYEIAISKSNQPDPSPTGSIRDAKSAQKPSKEVLKPNEWNHFEITVVGQQISVRMNGENINQMTGSKGLAGFVGLEENNLGPVQFRNLRIKDISSPSPSAPLATIQSDASQPRIQVIKDQGPNATEWALTPLDEAIPADIRQNLTLLREDLLDEGAKAAKGSPQAYELASEYCDKILAALSQRELARVNAGYRTAQAEANKAPSNQALNARRNYMMSWPQYAREESQRAALRENESDKADVKKQRIKVEWAGRAEQMRQALDGLYAQLRAALRQ